MLYKRGTVLKFELQGHKTDYAFLELTDNILNEDSLISCRILYTNNRVIFYWTDEFHKIKCLSDLKRNFKFKITEIGDNAKAIEILYGKQK